MRSTLLLVRRDPKLNEGAFGIGEVAPSPYSPGPGSLDFSSLSCFYVGPDMLKLGERATGASPLLYDPGPGIRVWCSTLNVLSLFSVPILAPVFLNDVVLAFEYCPGPGLSTRSEPGSLFFEKLQAGAPFRTGL
jgi:hypothetical protein